MANMVTALYSARSNLVEALRNHPDLSDVDVLFSWRSDLGLSSLFLQDTDIADSEPATLKAGRKTRDERFEIRLNAVASQFPTAEGAEERAVFIAGTVEDLLAEDTHALNDESNGIQWAFVSGYQLSTYPLESGFECVIEVTVQVKARLT